MTTPDGRFALVYNGELYNDDGLREELRARGVSFQTDCDTETLLYAWAMWGVGVFERIRGMYAFAVYDTVDRTLTLARDPLGVKPLYYHLGAHEVVFASEPGPIVAHPSALAAPDWTMVSAYCSTIRSVLGDRTVFDGVRAVRPGEAAIFDFGGPLVREQTIRHWRGAPEGGEGSMSMEDAGERIWAALDESVTTHLRSDVPVCSLLSGGIDSAATTAIAARRLSNLRSYCAGAETGDTSDDLHIARLAAAELGTRHAESIVTREYFTTLWPEMVRLLGMPLSTPNEVAINAVATRLRADGCPVTISGEGADELLAGYEPPMDAAAGFLRDRCQSNAPPTGGGAFQLLSNAWMPPEVKAAAFRESILCEADDDAWLMGFMEREYETCREEVGDGAASELSAHLRFQRKINLTGLLRRLDSATMLASVEGRTPFADRMVAETFEALPMSVKYAPPEEPSGGGGVLAPPKVRTKLAFRRACAGRVPSVCLERPKASFPLPFQEWVSDLGPALRGSRFAREVFTDAAVEVVSADPSAQWRLAWPMINIALWGDRCFG